MRFAKICTSLRVTSRCAVADVRDVDSPSHDGDACLLPIVKYDSHYVHTNLKERKEEEEEPDKPAEEMQRWKRAGRRNYCALCCVT